MFTILLVVHLIISLLLIGAVLLQSGKGSSMANVFGGGGMETVFGAETPAVMNRITTILATLFIISCVLLTTLSFKQKGSSVIQKELQKAAPVQPVPQGQNESPALPQSPAQPAPQAPATRTAPDAVPSQR
jgi:preprotein translocase subunit SecG